MTVIALFVLYGRTFDSATEWTVYAVSVAVAYLVYRLIDKPLRRFGKEPLHRLPPIVLKARNTQQMCV
jgi:peptidoglycan/LPS O-acetylase OafA/YrhL